MKEVYVLYDERATYDVDDASVYCLADTEEEARDDAKDFTPCVIYKYKQKQVSKSQWEMLEEEFIAHVQ